MIDTKITYKDSPNTVKKDNKHLSLEKSRRSISKKKEEITIEKMIRKPSKYFFQDLNTLLLR